MNQYDVDVTRFSELLSKYTGIPTNNIDSYLKNNPINNIFEHTASLDVSAIQQTKLEELRELKNLYNTMKVADNERYVMSSPDKAGNYYKQYFSGLKEKEHFVCTYLDAQSKVISTQVMFQGSVSEAPVYPRELVKQAILHDAHTVIFCHNHPSGSSKPSEADINVTQKLMNAFKTVDIKALDHIIIGNDKYYSFAEQGAMSVQDNLNTYNVQTNTYNSVQENTVTYSITNREDLLNKVLATQESIVGTSHYNHLTVHYNSIYEGSLTYQEDGLYLFEHDYNDFHERYKGFNSPEEAADYILKELNPKMAYNYKELNPEMLERTESQDKDRENKDLEISEMTEEIIGLELAALAILSEKDILKHIETLKDNQPHLTIQYGENNYEGTLSCHESENKYVFNHDAKDLNSDFKTKIFDSPEEAASYIMRELKPTSVLKYIEVDGEVIKDHVPAIKEEVTKVDVISNTTNNVQGEDRMITGIGIGEYRNGKFDIEIKLPDFKSGYSNIFVDNDSHPIGDKIVEFIENGNSAYFTRHSTKDLINHLETLSTKGVEITYNNPGYLQKDMSNQYMSYKNELSDMKQQVTTIEKEIKRLDAAELALSNYEAYTKQINDNKGLLQRVVRVFNKDGQAFYDSLCTKANDAKDTMLKFGVKNKNDLQQQKNILSEKIQNLPSLNNNVQNLNNKMNVLSSILQEIAKSSFKTNAPDVVRNRSTSRQNVQSLEQCEEVAG